MSTPRYFNLSRLLPFALLTLSALATGCGASNNHQTATAPATVRPASVSAAISATTAPTSVFASPATTVAPSSTPAAALAIQSLIVGVAFPDVITVKPGATITWTNKDIFAHTVTADAGQTETFDSKLLETDGTFSVTFATSGTFSYHCNVHTGMNGKVVVGDVVGGAASPAATPAKSEAPSYKY